MGVFEAVAALGPGRAAEVMLRNAVIEVGERSSIVWALERDRLQTETSSLKQETSHATTIASEAAQQLMTLPHSVPLSLARDALDMSTKAGEVALQNVLPTKTSPHAAFGFCATSGTSSGYADSHTALVFHGTCARQRRKSGTSPPNPCRLATHEVEIGEGARTALG